MSEKLLRRSEVESIYGLGRSSIYRLMRVDAFPAPLKISARAVRWKHADIIAWVRSKPRAIGVNVENV